MPGSPETRLVVLRGNSASGKSSIARGLHERFGRNLALVGQDNLRRVVLRERDRPGAANIGLIDMTARYALSAGFHTVVEGILYADRYGPMLEDLVRDHQGTTRCDYLDIPLRETLARHLTKPVHLLSGDDLLGRPTGQQRGCRAGDRLAWVWRLHLVTSRRDKVPEILSVHGDRGCHLVLTANRS
ncbi:AAA family ATPase [Streptomyces chartreusis]|uniref:AAA family ATPase n=1 Tax=Streptomyces chartreusis TaxID=1969 RepID=UPI00371CFDEA